MKESRIANDSAQRVEDPCSFAVDDVVKHIKSLLHRIIDSTLPIGIVARMIKPAHVRAQCRLSALRFLPERFTIRRKALIEPDVVPGATGDKISPPLMG